MNNLKPLQNELLALEKKLASEQQQWTVKRNSLSREVQRLKASISTLESKEESLRANISNKTKLLDEINSSIVVADKTVHIIEDTLKRKSSELLNITDELGAARTELENMHSNIDSKLDKYKKDKQKTIDTELEEYSLQLDKTIKEYEELKERVTAKRDELDMLSKGIAELREDNRSINKKENTEITKLRAELAKLYIEVSETEEELKKLYREKAVVSADTNKAEERHKQFIQYEARARKELETKNTSLLKKQEELGQEERFIKARRAILPEM